MVMWMLSKCVHRAGVGLARRPDAKVSAASRKLKSSGRNGRGAGKTGRMARRSSAQSPTNATAKLLRRVNGTRARSMRANQTEPNRGKEKDHARARAVSPNSSHSNDSPCSGAAERIIGTTNGVWLFQIPDHIDRVGTTRLFVSCCFTKIPG